MVSVFETSSARVKGRRAGFENRARPGILGVSGLVVGNWRGLQISTTDDNHVNANGEFCMPVRDLDNRVAEREKSDTAI